MVPAVTISLGVPTIYLPLLFVVAVTAGKDFYEDYRRK